MDAVTHAFLAHRADLPALLADALTRQPALVEAHGLAGFALRLQGRAELIPRAGQHLAAARAALHANGGTARQHNIAAALADWQERNDMQGAAARLDAVLEGDPHDLLALKLSHSLRFLLGDATGMRRAVEGAVRHWTADMPGYGFVLGCQAFALNETYEPASAERLGRAAAEAQPDDIWGAHAVAHVMEQDGRATDGLRWIEGVAVHLPHTGSFGRHVHWHAALFHLHRGDADAALALFDRHIVQHPAEDGRDFANAASLLWRLEAQGRPAGAARWDALAEEAARRADQPGLAFIDLHHVLALGAAGRLAALEDKLAAMRRRVLDDTGTQPQVIAAAGLPAARAIAALVRGDAATASDLLLAARPALHRVGGSHAQRDLFDRILITACIAAGRTAQVVALLADRAGRRAFGAWEERCRARLASTPSRRPAAAA